MGTASATTTPRDATPVNVHKAIHLIGLFVFIMCLLVWIGVVIYAPSGLNRDWVAFDRAASRAAHGRFSGAYADSAGERWPFLYPPFVLYLVLPLASLAYRASYIAVMVAGLGATIGALVLMRRLSPAANTVHDAFAGLVLGSGVVLVAVIPGQLSPLLLLALVAGVYLHRRGREGWSGAAFGALLIKPPIAAPFLLYLLVRREWQALRRVMLVAGVAFVSTLPMGLGVWREFFRGALDVVSRERQQQVPLDKQISLLGSLRMVVPDGWPTIVPVLWLASAALIVWLAGRALWQSRTAPMSLRTIGLVTLVTLVLSPRAYFYEVLLCVVPLGGLWLDGSTYRSRTTRRLAAVAAAGGLIATDTVLGPGSAAWLAGFFLTAWLLLEATDLYRSPTPPSLQSVIPGMRSTQEGVIIRYEPARNPADI